MAKYLPYTTLDEAREDELTSQLRHRPRYVDKQPFPAPTSWGTDDAATPQRRLEPTI
jgi:hypothetical protein